MENSGFVPETDAGLAAIQDELLNWKENTYVPPEDDPTAAMRKVPPAFAVIASVVREPTVVEPKTCVGAPHCMGR